MNGMERHTKIREEGWHECKASVSCDECSEVINEGEMLFLLFTDKEEYLCESCANDEGFEQP